MSGITTLIILLSILVAGFVFWKLSNIKARGKCIIPLEWRIIAALAILLVIPAIIFLSLAIAVIVTTMIIVALIIFIVSWLSPK